jgi:sugar O-acyltransferase (sialic acid O-acetyltransferase NeuD family)
MSKPDIILIGAGGHMRACIDVIEQQNKFHIAGIVGKADEMHTRHLGYAVIASDNSLPMIAKEYQNVLITVGQIKSHDTRVTLFQNAAALGFNFPVIISPRAYVSEHSNIAAGSIVMHDAIVNAGAKIGSNCIINSRALIEHDSSVDDFCHISTGAILNGGASLGFGSFVGSGSILKQNISVGKCCIVGMGVKVRFNLGDHVEYLGKNR